MEDQKLLALLWQRSETAIEGLSRRFGQRLMSMALLSLFTFTVFFVAQMSPDILDIVCPILAAVQCITLVIYLWGPEKLKYKPLKILYRLMYATSILVIPVFIFSFLGESSSANRS